MAKQPTIKNDPFEGAPDPLDLVIPRQALRAEGPRKEVEPSPEQGGAAAKPSSADKPKAQANHKKEKLTVHLTHDLIERVKNAAYWNPRLTIAAIAERGIAQVIEQIERENGGPYPDREEELKGGRPIGSRATNG